MKKRITKINSILLSIIMALSCATLPVTAMAESTPIKTSSTSVKLTFAAWGDPQTSSSTITSALAARAKNTEASANDLGKAKSTLDALLIAGDITENHTTEEYSMMHEFLVDKGVKNIIAAEGNHDIRSSKYSEAKDGFVDFTNGVNAAIGSKLKIDKMYYSYTLNGYKFIVLGSEESKPEESYISQTQLNWLDSQLKASTKYGKPVFVTMHQPLKDTHGLPDTWNNNITKKAGSVGEQSDKIKAILNKYKNVILITGHLHTGFGKYSYQKIGNFHSVNLPSIGITNQDGYEAPGLGYVAEVFDNKVVFRARDFINGEYLPKYDIKIYIDRVKSASLSTTTYVYNGKVRKPTVSVYDYSSKKISSENYTVTYPSGCKNVGSYKIKVTFKNKYAGNPSKYLSYTIKPKSTSISSLTAGKRKLTVKWYKRSTQTTGYQVQYSTGSKFTNPKTYTISNTSTISKTISNLSAKKRYYVRVRTYKTVNGKRYYSSWSGYKSTVTK
ncbi:MAG: metallophosphoesterase [Eubacterium sp.]